VPGLDRSGLCSSRDLGGFSPRHKVALTDITRNGRGKAP
jgi:hypothetical protein